MALTNFGRHFDWRVGALSVLVILAGCSNEPRTGGSVVDSSKLTHERVPNQLRFVQRDHDHVISAESISHYAQVDELGSITFAARGERADVAAGRSAGVHIDTSLARVGTHDLAAGSFDVRKVDDEVVISRGIIDERVTSSTAGIEQSWSFHDRPTGDGDLELMVSLSGVELERFSERGLRLRDALGQTFDYGNATWVDATGKRSRIDTTWTGTQVAFRVPQSVLSESHYPVSLDSSLTLAVGGTSCSTLTAGASPASPQAAGTPVAVTGNATCTGGAVPEYQFYYLPPGGFWTLGQGYGPSATFNWNTAGKPGGTYSIQVRARQQGSTAAYESIQVLSYTLSSGVPVCGTLSASASPTSPQAAGTPVAVSGNATCTNGGTPEYQFYYLPPGGSWTLGQSYGPSSTFNWNTTGATTGTYSIQVRARAVGSAAVYESVQSFSYSLTGGVGVCSSLTAGATPASPQPAGTAVAVSGTAGCSAGATPEYAFYYLPPGGFWTLGQAYGPSNTFNWNTTGATTGSYSLLVRARAQGSTAAYQATQSLPYSITSGAGTCNAVTFTANPASPQGSGPPVAFTANATCTGGATPVYEFYYLPPGGYWNLGQSYSANPTFNWSTVGRASGTYTILVRVRASTSGAAYQGSSTGAYQLLPPGTGIPDASQSTFVASPTSLPADGTTASTFTLTLKDVYGNAVAGQSVTFTSTGGSADTLSPTGGTTDSAGTLTTQLTSTNVGDDTVTATAGSMSLDSTVSFTSVGCAGLFNAAVTSPGSTQPFRIVSADFNGDNKLDVAVVGSSAGDGGTIYTLSVLLGNNDGSLQSPLIISSGANESRQLGTADFNEDGKPDLVVARSFATTVYLGNGDGTFQAPVDFASTSDPLAVFTDDVNNDSHADVLTVNGIGQVKVMRGNGTGGFSVDPLTTPTPQIGYPAVGDFNADTKLDLASPVSSSTDWFYGSFYGNGNGTFQSGLTSATGVASGSFLITGVDWNNDGYTDLASGGSGQLAIALNSYSLDPDSGGGAGTFWGAWSGTPSATPRDLGGRDIDGDGVQDLVVTLDDGTVAVYRGAVGSTFFEYGLWPATSYPVGAGPERMTFGDFNFDGKVDVAVVNMTENSVSVLLNTGCVP